MQSLINDDTVLFDENCYKNIETEDQALSYVRYFSQKAPIFRQQLIEKGWKIEDVNTLMDLLWVRVIKGCRKFKVPLTAEAAAQAKRLGI